jgi:hypothetical protein
MEPIRQMLVIGRDALPAADRSFSPADITEISCRDRMKSGRAVFIYNVDALQLFPETSVAYLVTGM